MTENLVLVPFGDRFLGLTAEEFEAGQKRGLALTGGAATPTAANGDAQQHLCTAEQMEEHTGVPHGWFLEAARRGEIPHHTFGKYKRFDLAEVRDCTRYGSREAQSAGRKAS